MSSDQSTTEEEDSSKDEEDKNTNLGNSMDLDFEGGEFDEEPDTPTPVDTGDNTDEITSETQSNRLQNTDNSSEQDTQGKISLDNPPHRVQKDGPREDRLQLNMFLDMEDKHKIQRLKEIADEEFDEKVHKLDAYLAALRAGINHEEKKREDRFIAEMRSIGYGFWDNNS